MIDPSTHHLLTLSAAAREVPNRASGRGVNTTTVWRWAMRGCRGVRLETTLIGGIRYTSREALAQFFADTTAAADGPKHPSRAAPQRDQAIAAAEAALDAAGI